jgi:hypothetical protein
MHGSTRRREETGTSRASTSRTEPGASRRPDRPHRCAGDARMSQSTYRGPERRPQARCAGSRTPAPSASRPRHEPVAAAGDEGELDAGAGGCGWRWLHRTPAARPPSRRFVRPERMRRRPRRRRAGPWPRRALGRDDGRSAPFGPDRPGRGVPSGQSRSALRRGRRMSASGCARASVWVWIAGPRNGGRVVISVAERRRCVIRCTGTSRRSRSRACAHARTPSRTSAGARGPAE